jgi:hypothetical protein
MQYELFHLEGVRECKEPDRHLEEDVAVGAVEDNLVHLGPI